MTPSGATGGSSRAPRPEKKAGSRWIITTIVVVAVIVVVGGIIATFVAGGRLF